jgi:quinol monooxygenase YgiN
MTGISVIASFNPKAGQEAEVEKILRDMCAPTRGEPGCDRYDLYRVNGAQPQFVLLEDYRDQTALESHRQTEHYKSYRSRITDLLSEPIKVMVLSGVDVAR